MIHQFSTGAVVSGNAAGTVTACPPGAYGVFTPWRPEFFYAD
jgi:hypothetical protein